MAGIGFELRKLTSDHTFFNILRANVYSSILSNGSWIISITTLVAIYFYLKIQLGANFFSIQFLVAVTYLVSSSLILSSVFQQCVNRYIADKIFEKKTELIAPSLLTSAFILLLTSSVIGILAVYILLYNEPFIIKLLMLGSFVVLNLIWLFANSLTGLKNYRFIIVSYFICYLLIFIFSIALYGYGLKGLLFAFYLGHSFLLAAFLLFIARYYPTNKLLRGEVFEFIIAHKPLLLSSVFFQLAVWIDKYCFWFAETSSPILDRLRASPIYDMPMFVAFTVMVPGLTVLFYEVEANFSRYYHRFYDGIRNGATLIEIYEKQSELLSLAKSSFLNVVKIQVIMAVISCLFAPEIFAFLGLAPIFIYLFRIDVIAVCLLVILIFQINILYYLDKQWEVCYVTVLLFCLNLIFSIITLYLGPLFYGYGFAFSLLCANAFAVFLLNDAFENLTYHSFMSF